MKRAVSLILAGSLALSLAACGGAASSASTTASSAAGTTLTGKGDGFGGVITATVTMEGDTITAVSFDAPDETESVGGAALDTIAEQIVAANGTEIDGVSGATYTTNGCKAAVLNALDPEATPYEENAGSTTEWPTGAEPVEIPAASNIVMASTYGLYTKSPDSAQDAIIKATLYWDEDTNTCYAIRFKEALTPWEDTGSTSGWACVQDDAVLAKLGDAVIPFSAPATEYSEAVDTHYAKYIQIGDIVWTGAEGSTANSEHAVVYSAVIDGKETPLCSTTALPKRAASGIWMPPTAGTATC